MPSDRSPLVGPDTQPTQPSQPTLVDAEEMHRQNPGSFWLPLLAIRATLRPGDQAKLCWHGNDGAERMWVELTERSAMGSNGLYSGILLNQPVSLSDLAPGAIVRFDARHVFDYRII